MIFIFYKIRSRTLIYNLHVVILGQRKENAKIGEINKPLRKQKGTSSLLPTGGENSNQPERISLRPKRKLSDQQAQNEQPMQIDSPKAAAPEQMVRINSAPI